MITTKMLERAKWEKDVREQMDREDEGEELEETLEVFDEDAGGLSSNAVEALMTKKRGKAKVLEADGNLPGKRRRQATDYFDGPSNWSPTNICRDLIFHIQNLRRLVLLHRQIRGLLPVNLRLRERGRRNTI